MVWQPWQPWQPSQLISRVRVCVWVQGGRTGGGAAHMRHNMCCVAGILMLSLASRVQSGKKILLEASGGVNLQTIGALAKTGVDRIRFPPPSPSPMCLALYFAHARSTPPSYQHLAPILQCLRIHPSSVWQRGRAYAPSGVNRCRSRRLLTLRAPRGRWLHAGTCWCSVQTGGVEQGCGRLLRHLEHTRLPACLTRGTATHRIIQILLIIQPTRHMDGIRGCCRCLVQVRRHGSVALACIQPTHVLARGWHAWVSAKGADETLM